MPKNENISDDIEALERLIKLATFEHQAGRYVSAQLLIDEAKALAKRIDPDLEMPTFQ